MTTCLIRDHKSTYDLEHIRDEMDKTIWNNREHLSVSASLHSKVMFALAAALINKDWKFVNHNSAAFTKINQMSRILL